jgi:hypothetical protein
LATLIEHQNYSIMTQLLMLILTSVLGYGSAEPTEMPNNQDYELTHDDSLFKDDGHGQDQGGGR